MLTPENFESLVSHLENKFQFGMTKIHEHIAVLRTSSIYKSEVVRVIFDPRENGFIGLSFHTETVPSDAVVIYNEATKFLPDVQLLNSYYQASNGQTYHGPDAILMLEHERQQKFNADAAKMAKAKATEEWELKQLAKGKITFH